MNSDSASARTTSATGGSPVFATTHWSVVLAAKDAESPQRIEALERLCRTYWYPLYAYVRRRGFPEHDAQDLTQAFFAQLLERNAFDGVSPNKCKFRSFLLASLNYFLADERDRAKSKKRGGGREIVSFDAQEAEERYRLEPADDRSPERIFERRWAMTLLDQVLRRLEAEYVQTGKAAMFQGLRPVLVEGSAEATYAQIASRLGMTEEAIKKAAQRMRRRYQQMFREEIAHTVATLTEVEEELRYLCAVLAR